MADLLNGDSPEAPNNGNVADPAAPAAPAAPNEGGGAPAAPAAPQEPAAAAPEPFTLADLKIEEGVTVTDTDFKALGELSTLR